MRLEGLEGVRRAKKRRTTIPDEAGADQARDLLQRLQRDGAEREVGVRHHLPAHLERLLLPRVHPRLLQPHHRRLAARDAPTHGARPRCARDGERAAPARSGPDRPQRSRVAYTSLAYTDRLDELGLAPSVGSRGDAYDNALAEAWVATFKSELVDGRSDRSEKTRPRLTNAASAATRCDARAGAPAASRERAAAHCSRRPRSSRASSPPRAPSSRARPAGSAPPAVAVAGADRDQERELDLSPARRSPCMGHRRHRRSRRATGRGRAPATRPRSPEEGRRGGSAGSITAGGSSRRDRFSSASRQAFVAIPYSQARTLARP
jgi:hypothetical protein